LIGLISLQARAQADDPLAEADRLNAMCVASYKAGKYDEAIEPCQRAVVSYEKALGSEHPNVATALNNLALLYRTKGDSAKAEPLYQRALAIYQKTLGSEDPSVANSLSNLAELYRANGDHAKAEPLSQRALAIREKALGREHPDVANSLNNLAELHREKGDYAKAEPLYQRALAIYEKALGAEHPHVATSLNNLASLYRTKGDYARAEPLYQRALAIFEKALGAEHPYVASLLNNLAGLYDSKGDYARAEPLYQRVLAIFEKALGAEHPNVAAPLNNLAGLYDSKGDYARAEPLYQRALSILEKTLGSEHPDLATALNNLASLYYAKGDYGKAEPLYERALAIQEKALGSEHPSVAASLSNLASLYYAKGDYAKAEPLYERALAIQEKALGVEHPSVATSLNSLAWLYQGKEDYSRAIEFVMRAQEVRESNVNAILATGSEKQKQLYLDTLVWETHSSVSLHAHSAPSNVQAARLALTTVLRRKGRALDAMTDQIAGLRRRAAPDDVRLLDALAAAQSQLANLQLSNDARLSPAERKARVAKLEAEIETLQGDISNRSAEFRARSQPVTLDAVRGGIPTDAALIEIFAYQPFNAKGKSIYEKYGKARYVAYVLKPQWDAPQFVDLGDVAQSDADLKLWRAALLDPKRADARQLGRQVDERVMRPIRKLVGQTKRLFISPDGALNLIPFAALVDENDKYLVETYSLNYLTSGRDLLRLKITSPNRPGAFIFANPTYNLTAQPIAACERRNYSRELSLDPESATSKREIVYRGIDFTKVCYPHLKGTAEEAARINAIMPGATVVTEKSATEAALKSVNAPPILHIATHGFFLTDQPQAAPKARQFERLEARPPTVQGENPLLRSGLIMAGANQRSSGAGEDGVLTAAEAAGLNLWGTKLIVLSACEAGLGEVVNGAGVYGLRRALVLAGSETQVMSLWKVDDAATRDLMVDYYTRLQRGEERAEAMRRSQLAMLHGDSARSATNTRTLTSRYSHPYYWAAFISSGDWRAIKPKN
jgi:CHAT domain-containing protein/Tfp pilus assembly protein PilF